MKKTNEQFLEELILNNDMYRNGEFEILDEYECTKCGILLKTKFGLCKMRPDNLIKGYIPTIRSAVNPTEYFINQACEVHGDKYDYSSVEYVRAHSKVKIISKYGVFEQTPSIHLRGHGCPTDGLNRITEFQKENSVFWSYTSWEAAAKRSKKFTGYKVYFLECWDTESGERFFKVGKTYRDVESRFCGRIPYSYKILNVIESEDAREICELEQFYKDENKEFLYTPFKGFGGMGECFSVLKSLL